MALNDEVPIPPPTSADLLAERLARLILDAREAGLSDEVIAAELQDAADALLEGLPDQQRPARHRPTPGALLWERSGHPIPQFPPWLCWMYTRSPMTTWGVLLSVSMAATETSHQPFRLNGASLDGYCRSAEKSRHVPPPRQLVLPERLPRAPARCSRDATAHSPEGGCLRMIRR